MNWNCNSHNKASTRMRNLTESRSLVRNQLKAHPNPNILFSLQNDPSPTTRIDVQHEGMWRAAHSLPKDLFSSWLGLGALGQAEPNRAQAKNRISFLTFIPDVLLLVPMFPPGFNSSGAIRVLSFFWPFWQKLGMSQ